MVLLVFSIELSLKLVKLIKLLFRSPLSILVLYLLLQGIDMFGASII